MQVKQHAMFHTVAAAPGFLLIHAARSSESVNIRRRPIHQNEKVSSITTNFLTRALKFNELSVCLIICRLILLVLTAGKL